MIFIQGFLWIFDGAHWVDSSQSVGIWFALGQHMLLTLISFVVSAIIALPIGLYIGHTGRGRQVAIVCSNIARALPTLGLLSILILVVPDIPATPTGYTADVIVFALLAIPPLLAGAYSGLESVDRQTVDAARAVGMTEWQILWTVEIPLGIPLIVGGIRSGVLQIIATVTLASQFLQVSLGSFVQDGLAQNDYVKLVAGAILIAALALVVDGLLAIVQRLVSPHGVSRGGADHKRTTARETSLALSGTPAQEGN